MSRGSAASDQPPAGSQPRLAAGCLAAQGLKTTEEMVTDIRDLDRRALETTVEIVAAVTPDQLPLPTPCAEWTLRQLLGHMIGQHYGFAAAARGETSDLSVWADRPVGADLHAAYAAAVADVTAAFAEEGVLDRRLWLPEIRDGARFPATMAIGFHFLDYVVHGWDVARSIGIDPGFDADLVHAALARAMEVPGGGGRRAPGAPGRPRIPLPGDSPEMNLLLATLGRSPDWPS
jgi:uncharacterized protein (TIGR03086 family)